MAEPEAVAENPGTGAATEEELLEEELIKKEPGAFERLRFNLTKNRPRKVIVAKGTSMDTNASGVDAVRKYKGRVCEIPKLTEKQLQEIVIDPILENYSYVRIVYDNIDNMYIYQVFEPTLTKDEENTLEVLKEVLVDEMEFLEDATEDEKEIYLRNMVDKALKENLEITLNPISYEKVVYYIVRDFIRYGTIDVMMIDGEVEDLSCDGVNVPLFVYHRKYGSIPCTIKFTSDEELDSYVVWLAQKCGKHISVAEPMLDATIPDGSRLQATLGTHVTKRGSSFTIRRFKENPFTPVDLIRFKTMSLDMMAYLWLCIENGKSMLVCGGTASGKTTTLNAILLYIPPQMKIVSIEDTRELNLPHENWIPLLTRSGFGGAGASGKAAGEIDMFDLLTAALRQRPQYMMVGEVRGSEAYVVFQAMATGKTAYTTFHAESVSAMVHRMENEPINLPRALISALNLVLIQAQVKVGTKMTRRVKSLTEIVGLDPDTNELITNSVYVWNPADDTFNYSGHSYVYEQIAASKNWTMRDMQKEIKKRIDLLKHITSQNISHRQVVKMVAKYYQEPERVMEMVYNKEQF